MNKFRSGESTKSDCVYLVAEMFSKDTFAARPVMLLPVGAVAFKLAEQFIKGLSLKPVGPPSLGSYQCHAGRSMRSSEH